MSTYKERYNEIQSLNKQINDLLKINKFKEAAKLSYERDKLILNRVDGGNLFLDKLNK